MTFSTQLVNKLINDSSKEILAVTRVWIVEFKFTIEFYDFISYLLIFLALSNK